MREEISRVLDRRQDKRLSNAHRSAGSRLGLESREIAIRMWLLPIPVELEQKRLSKPNPSSLGGQPSITKKTDPTIPQSK